VRPASSGATLWLISSSAAWRCAQSCASRLSLPIFKRFLPHRTRAIRATHATYPTHATRPLYPTYTTHPTYATDPTYATHPTRPPY